MKIAMASLNRASDTTVRARSVFASLATPYTFNPDLGAWDALVAVLGCLARIFGACLLFAVWGGVSLRGWSAIDNRFWRAAAVLPLVLIFFAALALLMLAISQIEK